MAGIASPCYSGVLFRAREAGGSINGASMAQFDGLRQVESMHMPVNGNKSNGFAFTSGNSVLLLSISIFILFYNA